jgi:cell division protein FtsA
MPGADELAAEILKFPTRVGFPEDLSGLTETVYSPMHATGVGLLRYGLTNADNGIMPHFSDTPSVFNRVSRRMKDWVQEFF